MNRKFNLCLFVLALISAPHCLAASMNVTVNPLGLFVGSANVGVDFPVAPNITVGPSLSFAQYSTLTTEGTGFGIGAKSDIYLSGEVFADSWVVQPFAAFGQVSVNDASSSGLSIGVLFGHSWFWPSGFNINAGLGAQYLSYDFEAVGLGSVSGILPAANFALGYAF